MTDIQYRSRVLTLTIVVWQAFSFLVCEISGPTKVQSWKRRGGTDVNSLQGLVEALARLT